MCWFITLGLFSVLFLNEAALSAPGRVPAGSLRLPDQPAGARYGFEPAFPPTFPPLYAVAFDAPATETNRIFVASRLGRIYVIGRGEAAIPKVFLDLGRQTYTHAECGLLGLAFHPGYASNRWFYVFYSTTNATTAAGSGLHQVVSRFETDPTDPDRALPNSEKRLISQFDEDPLHQGGDLHFGPDGYLYISVGDEGIGFDFLHNSQRIDKDFFSGILRIDVDARPENLLPNPHPAVHAGAYRIPRDNPFLAATELGGLPVDPAAVRTEFWAIGLRNPWRFSFDPASGELWSIDTGQLLREEINVVVPGGNYGWSRFEGSIEDRAGPGTASAMLPPYIEYAHAEGRIGISAGSFYHGTRFPELDGGFLFADFAGELAIARRLPGGLPRIDWLAQPSSVGAIGTDPRTGDILIGLHYFGGAIFKLVRLTASTNSFPERLSATGLFSDLQTLTPQSGVLPYEINHPFWSDHAIKRRWFVLPDDTSTFSFAPTGSWKFPKGAVWIKHFDLDMDETKPVSRRRIETRVLVKASDGVFGASYRWNDEQTDAELVPAGGADSTFEVSTRDRIRTQRWHFPSTSECLKCHNAGAGGVLGFNTEQLNRRTLHEGRVRNQLEALQDNGYFDAPLPSVASLPALATIDDPGVSVEWRVRSYLSANCAYCHYPGGAGRARWDARLSTPLADMGLINGNPVETLGFSGMKLVTPGDLVLSSVYQRISVLADGLHMPPLGTSELHGAGISLLTTWITQELPQREFYADFAGRHFTSGDVAASQPGADPDGDGQSNHAEFIFGDNPMDPRIAWRPTLELAADGVVLRYTRLADLRFEIQTRPGVDSGTWEALNIPKNQWFLGSLDETVEVVLPTTQSSALFRILVHEPDTSALVADP